HSFSDTLVSHPNAKAKLPGPPARSLKLGKPGWRPRSASAWVRLGGLACPPSCPLTAHRRGPRHDVFDPVPRLMRLSLNSPWKASGSARILWTFPETVTTVPFFVTLHGSTSQCSMA